LYRLLIYILFNIILLHTPVQAQKKNVNKSKQPITKISEDQRINLEKEYLNGAREKILKNNEAAAIHFLNCLRIDPINASVHYQLADLYYMNGQLKDAENSIAKAILFDANNIWFKKLQLEIFDASKQFEKAAKTSLEISQNHDPDKYLASAAYFFMAVKDYKRALEALDKLEKRVGINEDIAHQKEQIYLAMGNTKKAIEEVKKLIEAFPKISKYEGMLADIYMNNRQEQKAHEIYKSILAREPHNGYAAFALADYHQRKKEYIIAFDYIYTGMQSPNLQANQKLNVLVSVVSSRVFENQDEKNILLVESFIKAHPNDATGYIILADLLMQQNKFDEAAEQYEFAIKLEPTAYLAWNQLLFIDNTKANYVNMLQNSLRAIEYFPNEPIYFYYGLLSSYFLKEYAQTVTLGLQALDVLLPDQTELREQFLSLIGDAAHYTNNFILCDSIYQLAIDENPENTLALNNYAYFLSLRNEKLELAKQYSEKSLKTDSQSASYLDTYAWILYKMGNYNEAEKYILKALDYSAGSGEVYDHAGNIFYKNGKKDEAIKYWQKAKDLGADNPLLDKKIKDKTLYE
jgi:tetratricopeptide (TPR) repeat protein